MTTDLEKSHLLTAAINLAERSSGTGGPPKSEVGELLHAYYRHVAVDDLLDRTAEELYGALASHYRTAETRPQGTASVHVFTPSLAEHGWSAGGHSVVEVVTDDMPFLVDSVVDGADASAARRPPGRPPAVRRHPRPHRQAGGDRLPRQRVGDPARGRRARVLDARRDQPHRSRRGRRRDRGRCAAGAARRPRVGRGLGADAPPGHRDRRRAGEARRPRR